MGKLLDICCIYIDECRARYNLWGRLYYILGLPAAIFAVLTGTAALAAFFKQVSLDWMIALPALASAILGTAATFLKSEDRRDKQRELMVGWMELGDRVQVALMKCHMASLPDGKLSPADERRFLRCLIELNRAKCVLLSGKLRAGPEGGQGDVAAEGQKEPKGRGTSDDDGPEDPDGPVKSPDSNGRVPAPAGQP